MRYSSTFSQACLVVLLLNFCGNVDAKIKSTNVPRYDQAVGKAIAYLRSLPDNKIIPREKTIVAYALLKAGVSQSDPLVASGIALAKERAITDFNPYHATYAAAVDAMLLADSDPEAHRAQVQSIANRIQSFQCPDGSWNDLADGKPGKGDVSLVQYCVLALWAAQRVGADVNPAALDRAAAYLVASSNRDGGWSYRPRSNLGPENGRSSHNMTLAGLGTTAICRLLLHNPPLDKAPVEKEFGILSKAEGEVVKAETAFPSFKPTTGRSQMEQAISRGLAWNRVRFTPVPKSEFQLYFYYTLERAAALARFDEGWFTTYGDGMLTLQKNDGQFISHHRESSPAVATSFAILYYMRSTQQILDKQYASGLQAGGRLDDLREKKQKKELGPLDELLAQMQDVDFDQLEGIDAEAVAEKIAFGSREELIGQLDLLKKLRKHPNAQNRIAAYFALGRTGDFALAPDILKGLRDPNIDVNVQAIDALRYLSRKPNGYGITLTPFAGFESADDKTRLKVANAWRTKAFKTWGNWYRSVRPFDESGGLDELELRGVQP